VEPYREKPWRTALVAAVIAGVALGTYAVFRDLVLAILAGALLASSLRPFFSRTRFVLDAEGAEFSRGWTRTRRAWDGFRTHYADRRGVTLSPFAHASWLEPYRGMRLFFGGNREEVLAFIATRVPAGSPGRRRWSFRRKTAS
jgi:hypothetical protein